MEGTIRNESFERLCLALAQVEIFGSWGAKISALLRRLVWLQDNHPEIKSLVRASRLNNLLRTPSVYLTETC